MDSGRVLLVEDDPSLQRSLADFLQAEGFVVHLVERCLAAESARQRFDPHLILLDWRLPDGQGLDLLRQWRKAEIITPVIMLTAKAELIDKVVGLETGANDYLTKPFEPRELVARIRVQLRMPKSPVVSAELRVGALCVDLRQRSVNWEGRAVELAKMEFELLRVLVQRANDVLSRDELLNLVWGYDQFPTTRTVDTHVLLLRQKMPGLPLETVRGVGYRWKI